MTYPTFVGFIQNNTISAVNSLDVATPTDISNLPDDIIFAFSWGATDHEGGLTVAGLEVAPGVWSIGSPEVMPMKKFSVVGEDPIPLQVSGGDSGVLLGSMNLLAIRGVTEPVLFPGLENNVITIPSTQTISMDASDDFVFEHDSFGLLSVAAIQIDASGVPSQLPSSTIGSRTGTLAWSAAFNSPDAAMILDTTTLPAGSTIAFDDIVAEFSITCPDYATHYMAIFAVFQGTTPAPPSTATFLKMVRKRQQDR